MIVVGKVVMLLFLAAYSYYWPPYGGVNGGSHVASGDLAVLWQNRGCACPPEYDLGTQIYFEGYMWTCVDRGSFVKHTTDARHLPIFDFMQQYPRYGHKATITVGVPVYEFIDESIEIPY